MLLLLCFFFVLTLLVIPEYSLISCLLSPFLSALCSVQRPCFDSSVYCPPPLPKPPCSNTIFSHFQFKDFALLWQNNFYVHNVSPALLLLLFIASVLNFVIFCLNCFCKLFSNCLLPPAPFSDSVYCLFSAPVVF